MSNVYMPSFGCVPATVGVTSSLLEVIRLVVRAVNASGSAAKVDWNFVVFKLIVPSRFVVTPKSAR